MELFELLGAQRMQRRESIDESCSETSDRLRLDWFKEPGSQRVSRLLAAYEAPVEAKGDAREGKPPEGTQTPRQVAKETGLTLKLSGDIIEFTMTLEGRTRVVASCDKTEQGLAAAHKEILKQVQEKKESIEKKFGVKFSSENEEVEKQVTGVGPNETLLRNNKMIHARAPRLTELCGIEAALNQSLPSHLDADGKTPVKFYFLKDTYIEGDTSGTVANFVAKDKNGKSAVYFGPGQSDSRPITEIDAEKLKVTDEHSIQSLLTHELAHNTVYRLKWDNPVTLERQCREMGWTTHQTPAGETTWIIKAKGGEQYRISTDLEKWVRCDDKGSFLTDKGTRAAGEDIAQKITPEQVRDKALMRPPTNYFDNAIEMFAESMMMFRVSRAKREEFAKTSPRLYKFIREQDQADIDLTFGKDKKIRLPDGSLADNTDKNKQSVSDFEKHAGLK